MDASADWPDPQGGSASGCKFLEDVGVDCGELYQGVLFSAGGLIVKIGSQSVYTDDVLQGLVVGGLTSIFSHGGLQGLSGERGDHGGLEAINTKKVVDGLGNSSWV